MKSISRILGIVGLIAGAFGLGVGLYTSVFTTPYVLVNIIGGGVLLIGSLALNAADIKQFLLGRSSRAGASALSYVLVVLAILVGVNFIAARNHKRFDLTENKEYSLSTATRNIVEGLERDVVVTGFFLGGSAGPVEDLLAGYRYLNPERFSWKVVDPDKEPALAQRYGVRANGTVVVESGNERKNLTQVNYATFEETLTNALLTVTATGRKAICAVEGHGERSFGDDRTENGYALASEALAGENFEVRPLLLAADPDVPNDCSIVFIGGPRKPFFDSEIDKLDRFLQRGGKLYVMLDPQYTGGLPDFLERWGIRTGDDLIVEKSLRLFEGETLGIQPVINRYSEAHPITREFHNQVVLTQARSIHAGTAPEGYQALEVAFTSENSWAETSVDKLFNTGEVSLDAEDKAGPVPVAAVVEPIDPASGKTARLLVYGDSDWANNRFFEAFFNSDLFLNGANWLAGQDKQISIRPKGPRASFVRLTDDQMATIFNLGVLIFPQLLLTVGVVVAWRRR